MQVRVLPGLPTFIGEKMRQQIIDAVIAHATGNIAIHKMNLKFDFNKLNDHYH